MEKMFMKYSIIACIFTAMLFWGGCGIRSEDEEGIEQEEIQEILEILKEEALEIAAKEIEKFPEAARSRLEGVEPEVRRDGNTYIVTYPTDWPPGVMGADYHFQYIIDARTGEVLERKIAS